VEEEEEGEEGEEEGRSGGRVMGKPTCWLSGPNSWILSSRAFSKRAIASSGLFCKRLEKKWRWRSVASDWEGQGMASGEPLRGQRVPREDGGDGRVRGCGLEHPSGCVVLVRAGCRRG